ncbi:hypothetical protein WCV21_09435 [Lactobacillus helveticus]|nr:hypothetical protein [Lactobacillus helveticus]AYE61746.1 hypothetical protein BC335_1298 [Lactobacillus helveticus]NRN90343.1 hypothetical protein [Lactobacillus helveticus]NRN94644.1 hypothetical protein [Lactobacillus helveticus]NRO07256.1 hypothetical protein [Lactobacillus helveticus]NRO27545.1 hypothetical protein [Lactobacillus helveticus]
MNTVARGAIQQSEIYWSKYLKNLNSTVRNTINKTKNSQVVVKNLLDEIIDINLKNTNLQQIAPSVNAIITDGWCISEEIDLELLFATKEESTKELVQRKEEVYSDTRGAS